MTELRKIRNTLDRSQWFGSSGVYSIVDGQFGSTGKGLAACLLAHIYAGRVGLNLTNAGPNSGHTSYVHDKKIVLKQLPTFAVCERYLKRRSSPYHNNFIPADIHLSNGAVIVEDILHREMDEHGVEINRVSIGRNAVKVTEEDRARDQKTVGEIASTGQGTGPALMRKMAREKTKGPLPLPGFARLPWQDTVILQEVSQGFSLGINSGMYPYVTSRECTVAQGLADAGLPPQSVRETMMVVRTFPIRVGNAPNGASSGPGYRDQHELEWVHIGVDPELTTVTKRPRRIFTWSREQYESALLANCPRVIFVNFLNYLPENIDPGIWVKDNIVAPYKRVLGGEPIVIGGFGPRVEDAKLMGG